uniref:trypsin n=1 Tax=Cyprinus carpio TaxID=7962 RepID=A0A8C1L8J1_CYPCA
GSLMSPPIFIFIQSRVNVGIVNGTEAKPHSRPYMVSLQKYFKHVCGGFLISDEFVLTAAHCNKEGLTAVVGAHDLKKDKGSIHIRVKSYHIHPDFNFHTLLNDIMLLRKEVEQNKIVKRISIPTQEGDIEADSVCSVAGWGRLGLKGKKSDLLMEVDVKIMNNTELSLQSLICVSSQGDSGGPLVCGDTAVGITSFGDPKACNSRTRPEVYAKISAYLPWIHSIIANVK